MFPIRSAAKGTLERRPRTTDFTGQTINGYVVLYPIRQLAKNRCVRWKIQCLSCRHEKMLRSDQLSAKQTPICPCQIARLKEQKKTNPTDAMPKEDCV